MPIDVLMPALSPTMDKGNLTKWLKKEGDPVRSGDILAEIETDKATMEVEAVEEGILGKIFIPDGTADVPVHQRIAVILQEGEDPHALQTREGPEKQKPLSPQKTAAEAPISLQNSSQTKKDSPGPASSPSLDPRVLNSHALDSSANRIFASPLARRRAKEKNIDLRSIQGSGPHGRIIEKDIEAALSKSPGASLSSPTSTVRSTPSSLSDDKIRQLFHPGSYEEIPHDMMRKAIARRLVEAKQTIPHFYLSLDCQIDLLLSLREQVNAAAPKDKEGKPAYKISVNDMIIKAWACALQQIPEANVAWTETALLKHHHVDIGVAVSIPGGLITPIIRKAETKSLKLISNEMKDYAARARARKLKPEEYEGGSSAVSNLGMFGIKNFSAVINPPHATILAVGAGEERLIVKEGKPHVATLMSVTLSTDHRAVDGALGAQLLAAFQKIIEHPIAMLVG